MAKFIVMLTLVVGVHAARAECPTVGTLCDGVAVASTDDFWVKWNAADAVVYGMPIWAPSCCPSGDLCAVGSYEGPQLGSCSILVAVTEVWKGAGPFVSANISTRWMYNVRSDFGPPIPGYAEWQQESCALGVTLFTPSVYFLRDTDSQWETFECYGTGVYDRDWLVSEIGAPLSVESTTWGWLKATYR